MEYSGLLARWRADPQELFQKVKQLLADYNDDIYKVVNNLVVLSNADDITVVSYILASSEVDSASSLINSFFPLPSIQEPLREEKETNSSPISHAPRKEELKVDRSRKRDKKECPILSRVVCRIEILDQAIEEFVNKELLDLIPKFILSQTRRAIQTLKEQKEYNLVDVIKINDEFGNWSFDVLFGMLKVILCLPDEATFPLQWRLDEASAIEIKVATEAKKEHEKTLLALPSLADWLEEVCDNADMSQFYEAWLTVLGKTANVTTLQHLLDWKVETWDHFNMAPNAKAILREAVTQFKSQDTSAKVKQASTSKAEIEARIHRVKLFFYYYAGQPDKIGRLSPDAVRLAFEEIVQSGYEAEGLFDQLKELLFTETLGSEDSAADPQELEERKSDLGKEVEELRRTYEDLLMQLADVDKQRREMLESAELQDEALRAKTDSLEAHNQGLYVNMEQSVTVLEEDIKRRRNEVVRRTYHSEQYQYLLERANELSILIQTCERSITYKDSLLSAKYKSRRELLKKYRGIIFYGPPGTGKTRMMTEIQNRVGLTSVAPALAAAEVNRSLVGQTERILLDIANRARKVPHLLCVVSIDEIDSLAPKRDEKASQHKVDSLSVLLSIIEGIKDVPNLIFLAATNRIKMMDEAFLRRMSGQFFVGRPSATIRYRILKDVNLVGRGNLISEEVMELTMVLTTNFTGAAMVQLRSNIIVFAVMNHLNEVTRSHMINQCRVVAKQFSISLGGITLPDLFLNEDSTAILRNQAKNKNGHVFDTDFTGRMHVDLSKKQIQVERAKGVPPKKTVLSNLENTLHHALPRLVQYAFDRKIDFVQVFDIDWIVSNAAYDDSKMMEILVERISECREYSRSMMIFDLDSLVGVNNNQSNSNMGLSTSYSINNHKLFSYIVDVAKKARFVHNDNKREELWVVTVATHPFLSKSFKESVLFTPTEEETQEALLEEEKATKPHMCYKCDELYLEAENKLNSCTYHDGFLFKSDEIKLSKWQPLPRQEVERFVDKSKFLWSCCTRPMTEGGCKKDRHGIEIPPDQSPEEYLYRLAVDRYSHRFLQFKLTTLTATKNAKK